jgi:uncharacterized protein YchJ
VSRKPRAESSAASLDSSSIALSFLELDRELLSAAEREPTSAPIAPLQELARLALELALALRGDLLCFADLDARLETPRLLTRLLELPLQLSDVGDVEAGIAVARAFAFVGGDLSRGDEALILARAGRRDEALALVAKNLVRAKHIPTAEAKAGDAYRALGEADSAEVYYRRSLAVSKTPSERSEAVLRWVSLLSDSGREADAAAVLRGEERRIADDQLIASALSIAKVGRNDPCPCGSGKKYKKCHGGDA